MLGSFTVESLGDHAIYPAVGSISSTGVPAVAREHVVHRKPYVLVHVHDVVMMIYMNFEKIVELP